MNENIPTDANLVAQTLTGDYEAFGCLFDRYARMVRAVVGRVSLDWSAVEDLTQESFLRAFQKLDKLQDHKRFGAWIVGIARQVARERKRTLRRDRHQFTSNSLIDIIDMTNREAELEDAEQFKLLMQNLKTLSDQEQLAIHAYFLQERNANQAAELLELSRSGFYSLLKKALARLSVLVQSDIRDKEVEK